jgi:hypothetical protein
MFHWNHDEPEAAGYLAIEMMMESLTSASG